MQNFRGKTIIFGAPKDYNFSEIIEQELKCLGFKVINISYNRADFKYKNIFERLENFVHKNFLGHKDYKQRLCTKYMEDITMKHVGEVSSFDYALLIRPDQYSLEIVSKIKQKTLKISGYQWDGLKRYPAVFKYIDWFDRFFVFDPDDISVKNVLPITNFYTDSFQPHPDPENASDVYYLGNYNRRRASQVEKIITALQGLNLRVKYHIYYSRKGGSKFKGLDTTREPMPYTRNLHLAYNSKILVDVPKNVHKGLSFRTFEAIGFGKKLVTTNKDVMRYDFYHPNNIFIWGNHDMEGLKAFLRAPFIPLRDEVRKKYSFTNWISYILGEDGCQPIELPNR